MGSQEGSRQSSEALRRFRGRRIGALYDELAITLMDAGLEEERFVKIGADALNRILVVVYTWQASADYLGKQGHRS